MNFYYNDKNRFKERCANLKIKEDYDVFKLFWGEIRYDESLVAELLPGAVNADVLYYKSDPCNFAISERLQKLFITNDISGGSFYDLSISNSNLSFNGLSVTGRCGDLIRPLTRAKVKGFDFDVSTWDGSDLFCPQGYGFLFFSEKICSLISANNIKGFKFENINSIHWYSSGGVYKGGI